MSRKNVLSVIAIATIFAFPGMISAQGASSSASEATSPVLRIQLVIARYMGEKKVSSTPYVFTTGVSSGARIRMGVEVPIVLPNGMTGYKSVGTDIDCNNVMELPGGRYTFGINVQNTAAVADPAIDSKEKNPLFRSFSATFTPVLRDGQTMQTVASSDPVSGEVVKIEVTLNLVR